MTKATELLGQLGGAGGVRKNRFNIELEIPGLMLSNKLNILCSSASFPQRSVGTIDVFHKGRKFTLRGDTDYGGTMDLEFIDDSSMSIRKALDKWIQDVDNPQDVPSDTYLTTMKVFQLSHLGINLANRVYGYELKDVWITNISEVQFSSSEADSLTTFSCTLNFSESTPLITLL